MVRGPDGAVIGNFGAFVAPSAAKNGKGLQAVAGRADATVMVQLTMESWLAIGVIVTISVTGALYVLASIVRDANRRIELFRQVSALRLEYAQRVRELQARGYKVDMPAMPELDDLGAPRRAA
jgi:hypothetical protein